MIQPVETKRCSSRRLLDPRASILGGAVVAVLACGALQALAAQELPAPATATAAASATAPAGDRGPAPATGDTAGQEAGSVALPPPADGEVRPASPAADGNGIAQAPAASEKETAATPPGRSVPEASGTESVTAGMPVWKLFVVDAREILTAPAHWTGHDWTVFGAGVAGAAALTLADKHLRTEALRGDSPLETKLANDFRYFGNYATFSLLGAFYIGGRIGHDTKAQETAIDGLFASILAGGVITGVIKEVAGRSRPATHKGVYDFHPFSGNASFPSGEATEAFAAGSVIATQYPHLWVEALCYGTASLVAFARMREDGHWASDVAFGALIGTTVGRAVVHLNRRLRTRVNVAPLLAPHAQGLTLQTAF
jgi:membrane-associated phospholipid phosphatase